MGRQLDAKDINDQIRSKEADLTEAMDHPLLIWTVAALEMADKINTDYLAGSGKTCQATKDSILSNLSDIYHNDPIVANRETGRKLRCQDPGKLVITEDNIMRAKENF